MGLDDKKLSSMEYIINEIEKRLIEQTGPIDKQCKDISFTFWRICEMVKMKQVEVSTQGKDREDRQYKSIEGVINL